MPTTSSPPARTRTSRARSSGAKEEGAWECKHGGYTGTNAEESDFVLVAGSPMSPAAAEKYAQHLLDSDNERIRDKWGPAGAIPMDDGTWLFVGYASS